MRSDTATPDLLAAPGNRTAQQSSRDWPTMQIIDAPSTDIEAIMAHAAEDVRDGSIRYYLAAGTDLHRRPLWAHDDAEPDGEPRSALSVAEDILHCREVRDAVIEDEVRAVGSWLTAAPHTPKTLAVEIFGAPDRGQIGFIRDCCRRLRGQDAGRLRIVILRHTVPAGQPAPHHPPTRSGDEILLALATASGHVPTADLDRWATLRAWDAAEIAALTSRRGPYVTYADIHAWSRARTACGRLDAGVVAELETMIATTTQAARSPQIAARITDPALAMAALSRLGCAEAADTPGLLLTICGAMLRHGQHDRWIRWDRATTIGLYLAAFVAGRQRLSPAAASRTLDIARRSGVDPAIRSLLAYHLGQLLAKDPAPASRDASADLFTTARDNAAATRPTDPSAGASRVAAAYNGEALARYRSGDHRGAIEAELRGLMALQATGAASGPAHAEQHVLLLTNLADVYGRTPALTADALACRDEAYRIARAAGSLAALAYVVPGTVRRLIDLGRWDEAEEMTAQLLRHYDADAAPDRGAERAVIATCCRLAQARAAANAPASAADWYLRAGRRMRRAAPEALDGVIRNLHACAAGRGTDLQPLIADLAERRLIEADLAALSTLPPRR